MLRETRSSSTTRLAPEPSPGTPRHSAYPSGHSTYSAASSEALKALFPGYDTPLNDLADNIGMARLWAGIHWRSDHTFGQTVGKAVGQTGDSLPLTWRPHDGRPCRRSR